MANELPNETISLKRVRRTWRTNIESAEGTAPAVTAHRELVVRNAADDSLISRNQQAGVITRTVPAVLAETVTLRDGTVISIAELFEAIPMFIDRWETEDATAEEGSGA